MKKTSYRVVFELDDDGWWFVEVPKIKGCHTQALSLAQGRRRIREALALFIDDTKSVELIEDVRLPKSAAAAVSRVISARAGAEIEQKRAAAAASKTAHQLVERMGLSLRDAGELLGLSHQRIQQLLKSA